MRNTPRHLFLKLRQHGGNESQTGLTVTPYYNGVVGKSYTIEPRASAGVFRERLDLGEKKGIDYIQVYFDQTLGASEASCFSIEECELGYYEEEIR